RFDAAQQAYRQAGVEQMPGLSWTMAHILAAQRRFAEADAVLLRGRPAEPEHVDLAVAVATMQVDRGDWARAKQTLAEALSWGPAAAGRERAELALMGLEILDGTRSGEQVTRDVQRWLDAQAGLPRAERGHWLLNTLFVTQLAVQ